MLPFSAIPEFDRIDDALDGLDIRPVKRRQLNAVTALLKQIIARFDSRLDDVTARLTSGEQRLTTLENETSSLTSAGVSLDTRLDALEAANVLLLNVVANAGQLPASAPPRQWFRVAGDPAVYIGNGAGQPLTRLVPA